MTKIFFPIELIDNENKDNLVCISIDEIQYKNFIAIKVIKT